MITNPNSDYGFFGVFVGDDASLTRIGTNSDGMSDAAERNVISGGWITGVESRSDFTTIAGNYIGTNKTGTAALPNRVGVAFGGLNSRLGTNGDGVNDEAERNVVSGNLEDGVRLGSGLVAGNYIGTDVTGFLLPLGNGVGIRLGVGHGDTATIGGTTPGTGNVISGNTGAGIDFDNASGHVVHGNYIGVDKTGTGPLGNGGDGVFIRFNSFNNVIGAAADATDFAAAANIIAHNGRSGVTLTEGIRQGVGLEGASENSIRGNSIYANAGLGIDLAVHPFVLNNGVPIPALGVTPNDPLDSDTGSNEFQNFPELSVATWGLASHVQGSLHSSATSDFVLDFYANAAVDPSGYGEGQRWLGSTTVTTDANGSATFDAVVLATAPGEFVTATATDAAGNTSEFSAALEVQVQTVRIDVLANTTNVGTDGLIRVAIFSAVGFDASQVSVGSILFAGAHAVQSGLQDVDHDGRVFVCAPKHDRTKHRCNNRTANADFQAD